MTTRAHRHGPGGADPLAAALQVLFGARREQAPYQHRGGPRREAGGRRVATASSTSPTTCWPPGCASTVPPPKVIGALLGAHGTTIATPPAEPPPAGRPPPQPAAPAPGIRLRTLDDLREYASAAGINLAIPEQPQKHPDHEEASSPNPT